MHAAILAIELYLLLVVVDVLLAWIQEDPTRVPRRFTHLLTEPFQRPIRSAWARLAPGRLHGESVDLAIRGGAAIDDNLVARKIFDFHGVCVASPEYLARRGTPATPEALSDHDCLVNSGLRTMPGWLFFRDGQPFQVDVDGPFRCDDGLALVSAAEAGLGIAYEPIFIAGPAIARGTVVSIPFSDKPYCGAFFAVYANRRHLPMRVRVFIDHLLNMWQEPPWQALADDHGGTA